MWVALSSLCAPPRVSWYPLQQPCSQLVHYLCRDFSVGGGSTLFLWYSPVVGFDVCASPWGSFVTGSRLDSPQTLLDWVSPWEVSFGWRVSWIRLPPCPCWWPRTSLVIYYFWIFCWDGDGCWDPLLLLPLWLSLQDTDDLDPSLARLGSLKSCTRPTDWTHLYYSYR